MMLISSRATNSLCVKYTYYCYPIQLAITYFQNPRFLVLTILQKCLMVTSM